MIDNDIDSSSSTAERLENIRYKLLEQFCMLMQLNIRMHHFGKNIALLVEESLNNNSDEVPVLHQKKTIADFVWIENKVKNNERNKATLKLLYEKQERYWQQSKIGMETAILDFNELTNEIERMLMKLTHYSIYDSLTGVHNRFYFDAILNYEVSRSKRHQHTFSLLMVDLDGLKKINDTFGHVSGDDLLKQFSDIVKIRLRKNDLLARIGGDEFSILLAETNADDGEKIAQSLLKQINETIFKDSQNHAFHTSISIGIANYPQNGQIAATLRKCADEALYKAKMTGKNKVVVY